MTTEEIRIMFCNEINEMISGDFKKFAYSYTALQMYCLAMVYINGDYPEYVKTLWGVGKKVNPNV